MTTPNGDPTDKELQAQISARGDEAYQVLANAAAKRVWTVLQNLIEVRSRASKGVIEGEAVTAIFMGSAAGVGMIMARMHIDGPDGGKPPEIAMVEDFANQVLGTIEQMRFGDPGDPIAKAVYATRHATETAQ